LAAAVANSGGCFWLAVGGAGVAGYQVGKDDRSLGTKVDDAAITSGVKAKLVNDGRVNALDVNVDTYEGVVTLHGHVSSRDAAGRAVQLARSVKGVKDVQSRLVIVPQPSD
jgi:hyperosmotically inducible protein